MSSSLVLSFHFLDARFHGRGDGGEPEWPPSPLRAFQALVATAGTIDRGRAPSADVRAALGWLERAFEAAVPRIVAPFTLPDGRPYRLSVPNNALDLVSKAWSRGNYSMEGDANPSTHRAMKTIRPTLFREGETVHFLVRLGDPVTPDEAGHVETLKAIARNVAALGWGIDLVVARVAVLHEREVEALAGERWLEGPARRYGLRVPVRGTLEALEYRHREVLSRIHGDVWKSPRAFTRFKVVTYRRASDVEERAWTAFTLRDRSNSTRFRNFDSRRDTAAVAGMLRHVTHWAATTTKTGEWPETKIAAFVLGHGEANGEAHRPPGLRRFAYVPLPTIHRRGPSSDHVGAVRRVLVTTFADDCANEVAWAGTALAGRELVDEQRSEPIALLEPIVTRDSVLERFVPARGAFSWASVTPVVLPGYDDPAHLRRRLAKGIGALERQRLVEQLESRIDRLLRKAISQAGLSDDLSRNAVLSWQRPAFLSGPEHATRYRLPRHLQHFPRLHVRIEWRDASGQPIVVPGPICLGGGRHYGLGLFMAIE